MQLIFDIETAPLSAEYQAQFEPEFEARANLKDPAKIKADIENKREDWRGKAQLDPTRSKVCAYGYAEGLEGVPQVRVSDNEESLLRELKELLQRAEKVYAHNIGYDLGFLKVRWAMTGISPPLISAKNADYWFEKYADTKALWKPKAACTTQPAGLDFIGKALGLGSKPGSGKDFYKWENDRQIEYLTHDIRVCQEIVRRMA